MATNQTAANVTFSKPGASQKRTGYIWVAPLGTAVPTDATSELDDKYMGLGYLSEDGLTEPSSLEAGDSIVAAGGDTVATGDPTFTKTWTGSCIEALNDSLMKVVYGTDNVKVTNPTASTDGSIAIDEKARDLTHWVIVIDELLKDKRKRRNIMADATFLVSGDITHSHTALMNFDFTITAYPTENMPAQKIYITIPKTA